ncbi:hypothetical protein [Desulfogranum mediterraneum]|uniref:hypothetical protein n=1 Tax=Desulfogranum mediterraneum TaxID=160661 RepID=UPI00040EA6D2|nr:hypothetical protein [Desulfogranum mediterraneum]
MDELVIPLAADERQRLGLRGGTAYQYEGYLEKGGFSIKVRARDTIYRRQIFDIPRIKF